MHEKESGWIAQEEVVNPESFPDQIRSTAESGTDSSFVSYSAQTGSSTGFQAQPRERKSVNSIRTR